jgi:hypothetical protein
LKRKKKLLHQYRFRNLTVFSESITYTSRSHLGKESADKSPHLLALTIIYYLKVVLEQITEDPVQHHLLPLKKKKKFAIMNLLSML